MKSVFYNSLNIESQDNDVVFWSDTHFGHKCDAWQFPLWKQRNFSSIEEHDDELIKRWNIKSNENSTFFHLGDFIFGFNAEKRFEMLMNQLNFKELYIMPGNHFSGWKQHFNKQVENVWNINEKKRVVFVPNYLEACVNDQVFVMSHYPIISFNKQYSSFGSSIHLFGHTHNNIRKSEAGPILYKAKAWEVSVENSLFPLTAGEVKSIFKNKLSASILPDNPNTSSLN